MSGCTVQQKCSSTGKDCADGDRACTSAATQDGLEIVCEVRRDDTLHYVYCPADAAQRDSSVVWILLVVATLIAVVGVLITFVVARKTRST